MVAELEKRASADGVTPIDYVCERVASGDTLRTIARDIGVNIGRPEFSAGTLSSWVNQDAGRKQQIAAARALYADMAVEEGQEILDELAGTEVTKEEIQLAKARADYRQWLASKWNRTQYGADTASVNVQVNAPLLHLDALRQRALPVRASVVIAPPSGPDVELA